VADLEDIRAFALALPGVREVDWHGEPFFQVGSKSFVHRSNGAFFMKLDKAHQELLFEARPDVFTPMIVGPMRWSRVEIDGLDPDELAELVLEAWTQIVPKKVSKAYAASPPGVEET
jgi:hypothetical protein